MLELLADDPFRYPPPYEALVGDLRGAFSRRLNIQHRLVYQVGLEVIRAASYLEAAGLVLALREGIAPEAVRRPFSEMEVVRCCP